MLWLSSIFVFLRHCRPCLAEPRQACNALRKQRYCLTNELILDSQVIGMLFFNICKFKKIFDSNRLDIRVKRSGVWFLTYSKEKRPKIFIFEKVNKSSKFSLHSNQMKSTLLKKSRFLRDSLNGHM